MYNMRDWKPMDKVTILGVGVDALSLEGVLGRIHAAVSSGEHMLVSHVNITGLNLAYEQPWLRDFYNHCDLVYCDGMGVQLAARWSGAPLPERFTLADWIWRLAKLAVDRHFSIYLLGNPPGMAERAAQKLTTGYPGLQIAGTQHGYFDKSPGQIENQAVIEAINAVRPNVLLVGFGMPIQERWLKENWPRLKVNVAITCGALFEYLAGDLKRGPEWMTQNYLEWLARLVISPRRYARRYLRDIPLFMYRLARQRLYG
jgi:N-acetylglucosaminyldiphosphoundecaprenol N-acetyl-beta-D-mannosaminyltransferase